MIPQIAGIYSEAQRAKFEAMQRDSQAQRLASKPKPNNGEGLTARQAVKDSVESLAGMIEIPSRRLTAIIWHNVKKVPNQERCDVAQSLALELLKYATRCRAQPSLAYAICQRWVGDWWARYARRQHYSLDASLADVDSESDSDRVATFGELLVGEADFEARQADRLDGTALWQQLPDAVKRAVAKRLIGRPLAARDRMALMRYVRSQPTVLARS